MKKILLFLLVFVSSFTNAQIVSVTPNNGNRAQTLQVTITAASVNFLATSPSINVTFTDQFSNILPATFSYPANSSQLVASLSIPGYAVPGLYDVRAYDNNGNFDLTLNDGFTVNNAYTYTIQGNVRFDSNSNGCDPSDPSLPNQAITFSNGGSTGNLISDGSGFYSYYDVQVGNNIFIPIIQNPTYFTVSPTFASVNISPTNNLFIQDFCVTPNGTHNDLEVSLMPYIPARPGFNAVYKIIYKNKGTTTQNGNVTLSFNDNLMDYVTATPAIITQGTNTLVWSFSNLAPFESREIEVTMNINTPSETPPVNVGNILNFTAVVNGATDETPTNNTSTLNQTVVGSYDPNDKTCTQGTMLSVAEVGKYLTYTIRFENTGTANAEFIVIRDVIDTSKFEISTLTPVSGSHSFITKTLNTNQVEFIFENINLPFDDANNDGYVTFRIKTKPTLTIGTNISNTANIYFDYNLPITTNTYTTTVVNPLSLNDFEFSNQFTLSPIPVKTNLNITAKNTITISEINIYNTIGQLILTITNPSETIDVSNLKTGSYFIKIISDKGTSSSKFIKE